MGITITNAAELYKPICAACDERGEYTLATEKLYGQHYCGTCFSLRTELETPQGLPQAREGEEAPAVQEGAQDLPSSALRQRRRVLHQMREVAGVESK